MNIATVHSEFGFPIATADNIFSLLSDLGIRQVEHSRPVMDFEEYMASDLTEKQRSDAVRFGPKREVVIQTDKHGEPFHGFRTVGKNWATVFTLLPGDLVPIVGEYKHGADEVTLVPPSGVLHKVDTESPDPMAACGRREWEEETGLKLDSVTPLTGYPLMISGRQSTVRYYPFLGQVTLPIVKGKSKLDDTENLKMVLVPLQEWLKLIDNSRGIEDCAVSTTFLALRRLGKM